MLERFSEILDFPGLPPLHYLRLNRIPTTELDSRTVISYQSHPRMPRDILAGGGIYQIGIRNRLSSAPADQVMPLLFQEAGAIAGFLQKYDHGPKYIIVESWLGPLLERYGFKTANVSEPNPSDKVVIHIRELLRRRQSKRLSSTPVTVGNNRRKKLDIDPRKVYFMYISTKDFIQRFAPSK